jgi:hypothetical protein
VRSEDFCPLEKRDSWLKRHTSKEAEISTTIYIFSHLEERTYCYREKLERILKRILPKSLPSQGQKKLRLSG